MEEKSYPDVASFLIRFVQDQPEPGGNPNYRIVVRYIQTDQEQFFTRWEEVESFMQQVIPLEFIKNKQKE